MADAPTGCLQVQAGAACQNNCLFCTDVGIRGTGRVQGESVRQILEQGVGFGEVIFSRLEPTLEGELLRWVGWAAELGYPRICVVTNGRRLGKNDLAARLVHAGLNGFVVSLHGPTAAVHDGLTRRAGSFDETVAGLEAIHRLRRTGDLGLRIVTTACAPNLDHLQALQTFVERFSPDGHGWNALLLTGEALKHADELAVDYPRLVEELARCIQRRPAATPGLSHVPFCLAHGRVPLRHLPRAEQTHVASVDREGTLTARTVQKLQRPHEHHQRCVECALRHCCQGLSAEYVARFGWDPVRPLDSKVAEALAELPEPVAAPRLLPTGRLRELVSPPADQWEVLEARVTGGEAHVHLRARRPDVLEVRLVLTARDEDGPAFRRTQDFNVALRGTGYSDRERAMAGAIVDWIGRAEKGRG